MKKKDLCTNKKIYKDLVELGSYNKKTFKQLSVPGTYLTKYAVAQFLREARFSLTIVDAILFSFKCDPYETLLLTKAQVKKLKKLKKTKKTQTQARAQTQTQTLLTKEALNNRIELLYKIAQADFIQLVHQLNMTDSRFAAGTKVLAEMRNIINNSDSDNRSPQQAILNITTTNKKTKREKAQEKKQGNNDNDDINNKQRQPLTIVEKQVNAN